MKNTKLLALALAAVMSLSVTACGNTAETSEAASASVSAAEASAAVSSAETETSEAAEAAADSAPATVEDLFAQGCTMDGNSYDGSILQVHFVNADHTAFYWAECAITQEQCDEFFAIDFFAEDYDQQCQDFLTALPDVTIVSLNDQIPDLSEFDVYVGKTVQELEDSGLEFAGYTDDEDGKLVLEFFVYPDEDSDTSYTLHIYPEGEPEDDASYNDETILTLKVGRIVFWDIT